MVVKSYFRFNKQMAEVYTLGLETSSYKYTDLIWMHGIAAYTQSNCVIWFVLAFLNVYYMFLCAYVHLKLLSNRFSIIFVTQVTGAAMAVAGAAATALYATH